MSLKLLAAICLTWSLFNFAARAIPEIEIVFKLSQLDRNKLFTLKNTLPAYTRVENKIFEIVKSTVNTLCTNVDSENFSITNGCDKTINLPLDGILQGFCKFISLKTHRYNYPPPTIDEQLMNGRQSDVDTCLISLLFKKSILNERFAANISKIVLSQIPKLEEMEAQLKYQTSLSNIVKDNWYFPSNRINKILKKENPNIYKFLSYLYHDSTKNPVNIRNTLRALRPNNIYSQNLAIKPTIKFSSQIIDVVGKKLNKIKSDLIRACFIDTEFYNFIPLGANKNILLVTNLKDMETRSDFIKKYSTIDTNTSFFDSNIQTIAVNTKEINDMKLNFLYDLINGKVKVYYCEVIMFVNNYNVIEITIK